MKTVRNSVNKFMNALDAKDWESLKAILSDNVDCDYTSLRGSEQTISREGFVSKRVEALDSITTHHLISNHEVEIKGTDAWCKASAVIWRHNGTKKFHTHALYTFELKKQNDHWEITSIKQEVLWHEGDTSIHAGAK